MNIITALFAGLLFFLLTPNILLRLPKNGSKYTVAAVHAAVFTLALYLLNSLFHQFVKLLFVKEGLSFQDEKCTEVANNDDGPFHLEKEDDPNSCKPKTQ
jgi:hypothetical protein